MKTLVPTGMSLAVFVRRSALVPVALLAVTGCSKSDVNLTALPSPQPIVVAQSNEKTAADRLVEIDRLLAAPPTGRPEESDRRTALRAERDALIASGKVPYRNVQPSFPRPVSTPPNNTVTQRHANGNVTNTTVPTVRTEPITVAQDSQTKNLSFLEQMTPSERERYLKTIKTQNTQRIEVDYRRR